MENYHNRNIAAGRIMVLFMITVLCVAVIGDADVFAAKKKTVRRALLLGETSTPQITAGNTTAISKMLKMQRIKGKSIKTTTYNNKTKSQIRKKIKSYFKKTTKNDVSYLYLSAHGSRTGEIWLGKGGKSYFTPAELRKMCDKYIKGKVVIIMSSCYSGNFAGDGFISQFISAKSGKISKKKAKSLARKKYNIICSAATNEVSYTYGISWATEFWCKSGGWNPITNTRTTLMADANKDKKITMKELYSYSKAEILKRCAQKREAGLDLHDQHIITYPAGSNFVVFGQ